MDKSSDGGAKRPTRPTAQSLGGKARAKKLSAKERSQIASKAALAKWEPNLPPGVELKKAIAEADDLKIGEMIVSCAVLEDGTRVLSERGLGRAFGRSRGGRDWVNRDRFDGGQLPFFLATKKLKPFIDNDLGLAGYERIPYRTMRGNVAYGTRAELLPNICEVWLKARETTQLNRWQMEIARRADLLMRGLANVAIIALIDEATGYQKRRPRDELQKILAAYISPTLLPWTERFPIEFFKEMFRVYGWPWPFKEGDYRGPLGPRYAGKLIKTIIFENLPPGVLEELDRRNPPDAKWQRRNRMAQLLTEGVGHPHIEKLVAVNTALFKAADNKHQFWRAYRRNFPKAGDQLELLPPPDDEI